MQAQVIPFRFETKEVRAYSDADGEPWFCAADVCRALGYSNSRKAIADNCRDKGVTSSYTLTSKGRQSLTFINEGNLYRLIIKSRKEEAQRFESWVCDEVLPAIRKHGRYEDEQGKMTTLVGQTIGTDGFHVLGAVVAGKVRALPPEVQRRATMKLWAQVHAAFNVRSAQDIPAAQLDSARNFIAAYALEGEFLPCQEAANDFDYPAEWISRNNPALNCDLRRLGGRSGLFLGLRVLRPSEFKSPIWDAIRKLKAQGGNTEALEIELKALRELMHLYSGFLEDIASNIDNRLRHMPFFPVSEQREPHRPTT